VTSRAGLARRRPARDRGALARDPHGPGVGPAAAAGPAVPLEAVPPAIYC